MRNTVLILLLLFSPHLQARIIEAQHFSEIYTHLTPKTIVILDIDDTLLIPVQMLGCDEWFQRRLQVHQKEGMNDEASLEKSLAEWEAVRHLTQMELVEPKTEKIIQQLQNQGFTVMGLTTQGLALATRTKHQLKKNEIDLTLTAPSHEDHYFTVDSHGILFRNGILFTSGAHKGKALFNLLEKIGYRPSRILFVNDKHSHLVPVEESAKERDVEFVGLRYSYSDTRKAAFDENVAEYQFSHSTFTKLLSDEEARKRLYPNYLGVP